MDPLDVVGATATSAHEAALGAAPGRALVQAVAYQRGCGPALSDQAGRCGEPGWRQAAAQRNAQPPLTGNTWPTKQAAASLHR